MSTADLQNLHVDIDVASPADYVDNAGPGLLPEGTYNFYLKEYEVGLDPVTGEFRNYINMRRLVVADGPHENRWANDLRVWTAKFQRNGIVVSMLGDFLRGIDDQETWSGIDGATALLNRAIDQNIPIRLTVKWEAYDRAGFEQNGGLRLQPKSPEQKQLRKEATVKGMKNFPQLPDGTYRPSTSGPLSGETVEARLSIDRVYPSSKR
jgi:hypothetical protein